MSDHDVVNYFWHKSEGGLSSNVFASCLEDYIEPHIDNHKEITIYSDGCTYQNRNTVLSNMLINLSVTKNIVEIHKYLEPGHTQMECDSVHSTVENALRKKPVFCPANYVEAIRCARRKQPYDAIKIKQSKYKHLQELKAVMPSDYHPFYDSLPHM